MKLKLKAGTTSKIIRIFCQDSGSSNGSGRAGIVASDVLCYYTTESGTLNQITTSTQSNLATYSSGGWHQVSSTLLPGLYEFGVPNAVIDSSAGASALLYFKFIGTSSVTVPVMVEIELDKIDYQSDSYAKLEASAGTIVTGNPVAGTLSTTEMTTNLTETTDDHYNGRVLVFTSGTLAGQATNITDYDGASKKLTFTALTEAPQTGGQLTSFVIV